MTKIILFRMKEGIKLGKPSFASTRAISETPYQVSLFMTVKQSPKSPTILELFHRKTHASSRGKFYYVKDVAAILNLTTINIYAYIHEKKLKARKVGKNFIITESDMIEFTRREKS